MQDNVWVTINIEQFMVWIEQPYDLPRYNAYTNSKFLEIERSDSFFIQNTKDYFFILVPTTLILFVVMNRIHSLLSSYKMRLIIKSFSYSLGILMGLIIQNINRLAFLAMHHLMNMFSFNSITYALQALTVIFIGICFFTSISYFFISQYLYGKGRLIFITNVEKKKKTCFPVLYYRVIAKPLI